jgi:hypothetical protein
MTCHAAVANVIEFVGTTNTLYLSLDGGSIRRAELNPDFRARPTMHDRIYDVFEALGYEHLDEDDPRLADE